MPVKADLNDQMPNQWVIGLCEAPTKEPGQFCFSLFPCGCTCIAGIQQRQKLLQITGEPYFCCAGAFPYCCLKGQCDENCLYVEGCCLQPCAYAANRYMIQTRFGVRNGQCDEFIIWFTIIVSWAVCILETVGIDVPDEIELAVQVLVDAVYSCMHAQQHAQIKEIEKVGYRQPPPQVVCLLPPNQQVMIQQACPGMMMQMPSGAKGAPQQQMMGQPQFYQQSQPPMMYAQQQGFVVGQQQPMQGQVMMVQQQPMGMQQQQRRF